MKYYVPATVDNLNVIQEKVFSMFPKELLNTKVNNLFYLPDNVNLFLSIPELHNELDKLGLTANVFSFAFYIVPPTAGTPIHIDSGDMTHSFNIPIKNCENTFLNFYKTESQPFKNTYVMYDKNINYYSFSPADCTLTDKLEMTTPHIIKVKEPHNVINLNNRSRITLLVRLKSNIDLSDLFQ